MAMKNLSGHSRLWTQYRQLATKVKGPKEIEQMQKFKMIQARMKVNDQPVFLQLGKRDKMTTRASQLLVTCGTLDGVFIIYKSIFYIS